VRFAVQYDGQASPSPAVYVVLLLPVRATLPGVQGTLRVDTEYPWSDDVIVRLTANVALQLFVRIPSWATNASVRLNNGAPAAAAAGTYHMVNCPAGNTLFQVDLSPEIRVERHWGGPGVNGVAVTRGPLLFALPLDEHVTKLGSPYDKCFESGCSQDVQITSTIKWAHALILPAGAAHNSTIVSPAGFSFKRISPPGKHPFAGVANGVHTVAITAPARALPTWGMDKAYPHSPQPVPASPVDCRECGGHKTIELVPFGSTRLRIGMLCYTVASHAAVKTDDEPTQNTRPLLHGDRFFGLNVVQVQPWSGSWRDKQYSSNASLHLRPGNLRYPGGTVGNYWDWKTGWFRNDINWSLSAVGYYKDIPRRPYTLADFASGLRKTGATAAVLSVNILTSNISYEVAGLHAAAAMGIPITAVEIGNARLFLSILCS
jgi:hypothetical protein